MGGGRVLPTTFLKLRKNWIIYIGDNVYWWKKHSLDWSFSWQESEFCNQSFNLGSSKWSSYLLKKSMKNLQNILVWFDLRNNTISNLRRQSQCKCITTRLTTWSSNIPKQFHLLCNTWKNCEMLKMCKMLNIYYQIPISILTPLKLKIKQYQLKQWLKRKNHST